MAQKLVLWIVNTEVGSSTLSYDTDSRRWRSAKDYTLRPINLVHNKFGYENFGYHNFSHKFRNFLVYNNFSHIFSTFRGHLPFYLFDFSII